MHAGVVQGVVVEHASGRPVARTHVRLDPVPKAGGAPVLPLLSRAGRAGQFSFSTVPAGLYILSAVRDGYFPAAYGQRRAVGRGMPIQVSADSSLFAELRLRQKGAITGRVLDENGVAAPRVSVLAYRARLPLRSADQQSQTTGACIVYTAWNQANTGFVPALTRSTTAPGGSRRMLRKEGK